MKERISLFFLVVIFFSFSMLNPSSVPDKNLTIILVRHTEKVIGNSTDPPLTEEGKIRAAELAAILKYGSIDAVFSTPYIRTRETVIPAAEDKGIKLEYYNAGSEKELLMRIFDRYRGKEGCVLIAGHSNTIHLFLNFLVGEERFGQIEENIYDNIFFAFASNPGDAEVLHLRYGKHNSYVCPSSSQITSSRQRNSHFCVGAIDTSMGWEIKLNFIIEYGIA